MIYAALLRGINVGGKNKIDMKQLKSLFEQEGMHSVETYIQSGNVIFAAEGMSNDELADRLERAIEGRFGFPVPVLIRSLEEMEAVIRALPLDWSDDERMKSDVMFLWDDVEAEEVFVAAKPKPDIDKIAVVPGAVLWAVDRSQATKSRKTKLIGTAVYQRITVRNVNTARKLFEMMQKKQAEMATFG